jgi:hypothetical protein
MAKPCAPAREQALHLGICTRRIADQCAMLGRHDHADPFYRGGWQFEDVA